MNQNIATIRKHYSTLTDEKIRSLVGKDLLTLTPDGLQVLKEEVVKRDLPLLKSIDDAFKQEELINQLILDKCNEIRDLPCPICNSNEYKLNAIQLTTVTSLLATNVKKQLHIGCNNCLMELKQSAEDKTSLLGWWGFWGLFETSKALRINDIGAEELKLDRPSSALTTYVSELIEEKTLIARSLHNVSN